MKFDFKEKNKNIKLGDVIFSHVRKCYYIVVKDVVDLKSRYRLLCLDDMDMMSVSFECIDDMISYYFIPKEYDIIQNENLVLSNSN